MTRLPVAVAGTGWWATEHHIPSLVQYAGADLVAVVDPDEDRLTATSDYFQIARTYRSLSELIDAHLVEAVVIATPSGTHFALASEALSAGLNVLVEKPMVMKPLEAAQLSRQASDNNLVLTVGYTFQHTAAARLLRSAINAGVIGDVVAISALFASMAEAYYRGVPDEYREVMGWRITGPGTSTYSDPSTAGGGQGQTQVTHAIGMQVYALGQRATRVYADMEYRDLPVDIADAFSYRFENGALAGMTSTGNLRPRDPQQQEFRYYGTDGFALHDLVQGTLRIRTSAGNETLVEGAEVGDPYPSEAPARHLVDLVTGAETENVGPCREATWAVEFLDAAYRSSSSGLPTDTVDAFAARSEEVS